MPTPSSPDRTAKDALFAALAGVAKALASGRRAEIVELLAQGERSVEQVADAIDQSVANTSHHLRALARAGLLVSRPEGTRSYYRLASDRVFDLWRAVREVAAERVPEVPALAAAYTGSRQDLPEVDREGLEALLSSGAVLVLDVRPALEHAVGHIPGALSIPIEELEARLDELPADRTVVAYCRGPYCAYADRAVRLLRARGIDARRLEDGLPEWRRAGRPVAVGG